MKLEVLDGLPKGNFVCTYCAGHFQTREDLEDHWDSDPRCRHNRNVSNQTQSKYNDVEDDTT